MVLHCGNSVASAVLGAAQRERRYSKQAALLEEEAGTMPSVICLVLLRRPTVYYRFALRFSAAEPARAANERKITIKIIRLCVCNATELHT